MILNIKKTLTLGLMLFLIMVVTATSATATDENDFEVVMLGVGTPPPFMHRFGPSTLVKAGDKYLLFDAGRGVTQRLWQQGIPLGRIDTVFLTHLHSDHVVGIPDLLLTGWLKSPFGGRNKNFDVRGPTGTTFMMEHVFLAFGADIKIRIEDQNFTPEGVTPAAQDIKPGVIYNEDGVMVTAIEVNHGDLIKPALGFRVDFDGRSVVISGDTKYHPPLAEAAKGTDLFIHAVAAARPELLETNDSWQTILDHHTSPEDVGRIFQQAQPKMAALHHLVTLTNGKIKPPTLQDISNRLATTYSGPLTMGADLTKFVISKNGVKVIPPE
jgi:ribonuclease Z